MRLVIYFVRRQKLFLDYRFETVCKMPKFEIIGWKRYKFVQLKGVWLLVYAYGGYSIHQDLEHFEEII